MSIAGIRQLKYLTIRYCQYGGSSKGVRDFLATRLAQFKEENPTLTVSVVAKNGQHPILIGHLGASKQICVKNLPAPEVTDRALFLRNQFGTNTRSWNKRQWTHYPSVQGVWTAFRKKPEIHLEFLASPEPVGSRLVEAEE